MYSSYEELIADYIKGKADALYTFACMDFAYYCTLMNKQCPLEEVQTVWQHCYDITSFIKNTFDHESAGKLAAAMDEMIKNKDQESLTATIKIVFDSIRQRINVAALAEFKLSPELRQQMMDFETSIGVDNGKYYLLRASSGRRKTVPFYKRKSFMMLIVFVMIVCGLFFFV